MNIIELVLPMVAIVLVFLGVVLHIFSLYKNGK